MPCSDVVFNALINVEASRLLIVRKNDKDVAIIIIFIKIKNRNGSKKVLR